MNSSSTRAALNAPPLRKENAMFGAIIAGFLLGYIFGAIFTTGKEADDD
jgi:predicted lipid-binding transport protein (Tim44 family)